MVFSNLASQEKEAFFSLLDEYFQSRPELIPSIGSTSPDGGTSTAGLGTGGAAASAVHRALASNPEVTSKLVSAGLKHGVPKNSPYAAAAHNPDINNAAGRFAAASMAFSANQNKNQSKPPPPPVAPRRGATLGASEPAAESHSSSIANPAANLRNNLVSNRKFGDVDVSSPKNLFNSLRNSTANKTATPPPVAAPIPAAFSTAAKKGGFAPPPVRRVASSSTTTSHTSARESSPRSTPPPGRRQDASEELEERKEAGEGQGEWAEALYDYSSDDPGDLTLTAGQRVLVTDKTSVDWWTGEDGDQKGLFPATYVRIL